MDKIIEKALYQLEPYDLKCISFVRNPYIKFSNSLNKVIEESENPFSKINDPDKTMDDLAKKLQLTTLYGSLGNTYTGTASTTGIVHGNISFSLGFDSAKSVSSKKDIVARLDPYVITNNFTLDDFVEKSLLNKEHIVFLIGDGSNKDISISDGIFHFRDKISRRIEIWYPGMIPQI